MSWLCARNVQQDSIVPLGLIHPPPALLVLTIHYLDKIQLMIVNHVQLVRPVPLLHSHSPMNSVHLAIFVPRALIGLLIQQTCV